MDDLDALAEQVQEARKQRGWSQQELANRAGVSVRSVSNFERKTNSPQAATLRAILRSLDLERDAGDAQASQTRSEWPRKVQVFLDMLGLFLAALPEEEQEEVIYDLTRQIVSKRQQ